MLAVYEGHTDHVYSLAEIKDGTLASSSKDKTVRLWDTDKNEPIKAIAFHNKNLNSICTMPDGKMAVAVDNLIKFYNL